MVTYTSLVGYEQAVLSGLKGVLSRKIMRCFFEANQPLTRRQVEIQTGIRISSVTSVVNTLMQSDLLQKSHEAIDESSGYLAEFLEPVWPQPFQKTFEEFGPAVTPYP